MFAPFGADMSSFILRNAEFSTSAGLLNSVPAPAYVRQCQVLHHGRKPVSVFNPGHSTAKAMRLKERVCLPQDLFSARLQRYAGRRAGGRLCKLSGEDAGLLEYRCPAQKPDHILQFRCPRSFRRSPEILFKLPVRHGVPGSCRPVFYILTCAGFPESFRHLPLNVWSGRLNDIGILTLSMLMRSRTCSQLSGIVPSLPRKKRLSSLFFCLSCTHIRTRSQ